MGCWGGEILCAWSSTAGIPWSGWGKLPFVHKQTFAKNAYHFPGVPGEPQDTLLLLVSSQLPGGTEVQFGGRGCCGWQVL